MPAPDGPQWYHLWKEKIESADESDLMNKYENRHYSIKEGPEDIHKWSASSFFSPADFPTKALQKMDANSPRAESTDHPDFLHEAMSGTGVPEHVTVYHHGDIPEKAKYASGSVDPNWTKDVREGWRSTDPSVNKGRLHIYLVPHQDILSVAPMEKEVFFRRGAPIRKKK